MTKIKILIVALLCFTLVSCDSPQKHDNSAKMCIFYVLNTDSKKFHRDTCKYLPTKNRKDTTLSREEIIENGYEPCKLCNP